MTISFISFKLDAKSRLSQGCLKLSVRKYVPRVQVFSNRVSLNDERVLEHDVYLASKLLQAHLSHILSINEKTSLVWTPESK